MGRVKDLMNDNGEDIQQPGDPVAPVPLAVGDVVELKSGSFPMVIDRLLPGNTPTGQLANVLFERNGEYSGKPNAVDRRSFDVKSLKLYVRKDNRDDLPF